MQETPGMPLQSNGMNFPPHRIRSPREMHQSTGKSTIRLHLVRAHNTQLNSILHIPAAAQLLISLFPLRCLSFPRDDEQDTKAFPCHICLHTILWLKLWEIDFPRYSYIFRWSFASLFRTQISTPSPSSKCVLSPALRVSEWAREKKSEWEGGGNIATLKS